MDNLGKNWRSLIFYFVAIDCNPRSTIEEKYEPKPTLARAQVPQRVINEFELSRRCLRSCIRRERLIGCSLDNNPISLVVTGCINVRLISLVMVSLE
jgi:hypothetical protein